MLIQNEKDQMFFETMIALAEACIVIENLLEDEKIKTITSSNVDEAKEFLARMNDFHGIEKQG